MMTNKRLTIFDRNLEFKTSYIGTTELVQLDIIEKSVNKFKIYYDNKIDIKVDSDFIHDNETQFFGIIKSIKFDNNELEIEATSNQYIFDKDIVLPSKTQAGTTGVIKTYITNFLNSYLTNNLAKARLPLEITNNISTSLTFSLPDTARNLNFSSWFNRYVRLYNLEIKTSLVRTANGRKIKVDVNSYDTNTPIFIDGIRDNIISTGIDLDYDIKNIITIVNAVNTTQKTTFYLRQNGTLTTNFNDNTILDGINETTQLITDYTAAAALEEASKITENNFKNQISLIVKEELYNNLSLNQKVIFVTEKRLQITSRLTKKVFRKGVYTLIFGDQRNSLSSVILKNFKKEDEYADYR